MDLLKRRQSKFQFLFQNILFQRFSRSVIFFVCGGNHVRGNNSNPHFPHLIIYSRNENYRGEYWMSKDSNPQEIFCDGVDYISFNCYWINSVFHNETKPAIIHYKNGIKYKEEYWENGIKLRIVNFNN